MKQDTIYTDEAIKFFKLLSPIFKENTDEYLLRCPYCNDSKKDKTKTRFYISKTDPVFNCFNCGEHGHINMLFVDFKHIINGNIFNENYNFNIVKNKNINKNYNKDRVRYEKHKLQYDLIIDKQQITDNQKNYLYLRKININDILNDPFLKYKIIFNNNKFVNMINNEYFYNNEGIGFLTYYNYLINIRNCNANDKQKYIKFKIKNEKDFFVIHNKQSDNENVVFCEGPFDALKTYLYWNKEFNFLNAKYYIATFSNYYEHAIKYFILNFKTINNKLIFLVDNDTKLTYYKYWYDKYKVFFNSMDIYNNLLDKDFGSNEVKPYNIFSIC